MRRIFVAVFALSFLAAAATRAHASDDRVSFFHSINIAEGEETHDTVCIFCSIHVDGEVRGDAVAILGSIHSNGIIHGDAVSVLGNISLGPDASIGGNSVSVLGSVRHHNNNQIGKELVQIPFALILIPVLTFALLIYVIRSLVWRARMPYPMPPPPPPSSRVR
ncbi:MAG TPA: hypothetical protein VHT28_18765 [Silvibacterium sp.]|jgi:hypothetical protein|nr:hypothetical protein [Silvibacterium sp.]